ncbi:p21-activated protein kinase-interacting protein 1-like [Oratosquilla oratoria]|uniref:p21-activated protein kinase-interacting protein 1-like n=1 Tax=Oratosquilla oratoria TaxID=337810 RepID=UPI003F76C2FC
MELILGTNEEYIVGYRIVEKKDGAVEFQKSFTNHAHTGSVKCIAVIGKYLLSGGTDEVIRVFDLKKRREVGMIMEHEGTVTSLKVHASSHVFSTADDGKLCIFKKGKWECEKLLPAHNGGAVSVSVHPTGKMALTVGKDRKLKTWNLIKGRRAYISNTKTVADDVHWSPGGTKYLLVFDSRIDLYSVTSAKLIHTADFKERIHSLIFITEAVIVVGGEGHNICLYDMGQQKEIQQWEAHTSRVKALLSIPTASKEELHILSASSDGQVKMWSLQMSLLSTPPKLLGETNTTCRNICMALYSDGIEKSMTIPLDEGSASSKEQKEKTDDEDDSDESDDEDDSDDDEEDSDEEEDDDDDQSHPNKKIKKSP